jgi:hypothetical protein
VTAFTVDDRVEHPSFGAGTVTYIAPADHGVGEVVSVNFGDIVGEKRFLTAYAPLSLVEGAGMREVFLVGERFDADVQEELRKLLIRQAVQKAVKAQQEPPAEPFDAGLLTDVLARPSEPPMRCDGLIPSDASTLVVAQRKIGKTTLELNVARALITGEPLLGRFDTRPIDGNVALLNYEVSAATVARWADEHGVAGDRLLLVNLRGRRNPLAHPEDRARLVELLRCHDVEAIIVDPFGRAYTGKSQNDSGEVGAWLVDLDRFVREEVGATDLLLSAHAGWNGERTRGASALEDWADTVITMTRDPADEHGPKYLKAIGRDIDVDEDRLDFDPTTRTLTLAGVGSRKRARAARDQAELSVFTVRAARNEPGIGVTQMIAAIREMDDAPTFQDGEVSKAAKFAAQQGLMRIEGGGPGRRIQHFALDPSTPANPFQSPAMAAPQTPATPSLYGRGRGLGGAEAEPMPRDKGTASA